MNRRAFLRRMIVGTTALSVLGQPLVAATVKAWAPVEEQVFTFDGHVLLVDQYCPPNMLFFVNPDVQIVWTVGKSYA